MKELSQAPQGTGVTEHYEVLRTFEEMGLNPALKAALRSKGYQNPTEIQDKSFETVINGRDLIGVANTGTGKTAAYLIPVIDQMLKTGGQGLVVAPTRELAEQIDQEFRSLTHKLRLFSVCFIGGSNIRRDISRLSKKNDLVIGTPGRLLDLAQRGALDLRSFSVLVLDEFDRLLDMGFSKDINKIIGLMHGRKQTLLFSATLDKAQKQLIDKLLTDPVTIHVDNGSSAARSVEQKFITLGKDQERFDVLRCMLLNEEFEKVLVFAETKRTVRQVCLELKKDGVRADEIHGNKTQNYRQQALNRFKKGKLQVLVATDVAARGLDITNVTHVINYQIPQTIDSYIHRIGRTGRAGKKGKAFTFVN